MDFNETKESYRDTIERSIAFAGKGLDFYTQVKADRLRRAVLELLPGNPRPVVLDIGCGHGYIHPRLRDFGFDVVGTDVAGDVLPLARHANPDVPYLQYDGRTLPFRDGSFDVVVAICVMHHVPPPQWRLFASEMKRVLRSGGIASVFEHNPLNPLTQYVVRSNAIDDDAVLLTAGRLRRLLKEAKFEAVESRGILYTPFSGGFFRALDDWLGWLPFGAQYLTTGRA